VEHIFRNENLPIESIETLKPGTNAVFKVGSYVIKIFAPPGMGQDFGINIDVELFGLRWAEEQNVPAPRLIASGAVEDKYHFKYMIMDYIDGKLFSEIEDSLSYDDKVSIGQKIRSITNKLNRPCENFTPSVHLPSANAPSATDFFPLHIDVMQHAFDDEEWEDEGFPASFQEERLSYLRNFRMDDREKVYCHGDFHVENILVDDNLNVYIVDFADAMYAPAEYEQVYVVSALFCFEKPYMVGYFGDYTVEDIVNLCMTWLPIHVWGHSTVVGNLKLVADIVSLEVMQNRLRDLIEHEKQK
jgi:aminoglycoside phosphotransferase (APT) family kinase protein